MKRAPIARIHAPILSVMTEYCPASIVSFELPHELQEVVIRDASLLLLKDR